MKRIVPFLLPLVLAAPAAADDWPQWRGPQRDGISSEKGLLKSWPAKGPSLLWQAKGLGGGFSSVAVAGGRIFTLGRRKAGTELVALDLKDGKELWAARVGGGDPNSTPTVDGDLVYALGRDGDLLCAEADTGKEVWRKNFGRDFGGRMMSGWGYSESPLIDGDRLVCTPGGGKAAIVALNKKTGETIWASPMPGEVGPRGQDGAGYSSIVVSQACGVRQYVQLTGRGIIAVAAEDGKPLWSYNRVANGTANIPTPIVKDDLVFCSSGYDTGAALLKVVKKGEGLTVQEVYFLPARMMQNHHGGMVRVGDYIYCGHGHNQGHPLCLNMKTGKAAWQTQGPGEGSAAVVYADGNLVFRYENGVVALIEANPRGYRLKSAFRPVSVRAQGWPHPVIANGLLYLRDQDVLMCYDLHK
jgi:outer membrane protein assembly factor BamB